MSASAIATTADPGATSTKISQASPQANQNLELLLTAIGLSNEVSTMAARGQRATAAFHNLALRAERAWADVNPAFSQLPDGVLRGDIKVIGDIIGLSRRLCELACQGKRDTAEFKDVAKKTEQALASATPAFQRLAHPPQRNTTV